MSTRKKSTRPQEEEPTTQDAGKLQPGDTSITAADLDDHEEELDAAAGSEFVDDRIREDD